MILSGGLTPENVADGHRRRAPVGRRRRLRRRVRARDQGPGQGRGVRRGSPTARLRALRASRDALSAIEHRFGPYGGQYVPETLMPALAELEAAWIDARDDAGFRAELGGLLRDFAGRPTPLYHAAAALGGGRAPGLPQARGPASTPARTRSTTRSASACSPSGWARRASSPRPAPASTASRPRPRARCSASSASSTWAPRTCAASAPTCSAWGCWARRVAPVDAGAAHAQGGRLGGDPRLGRQRRRHALRDRLVRRPGAVPGARARPAARDRRRGARADPRARRPAARPRDRLRRRRLERDRHRSSRSSTTRTSRWSASRPRATGSTPAATARR